MNSILKHAFLLLTTTLLVACGGSSSEPTQAQTSKMGVVAVSPPTFSTNVERDAQISVQFNGEILPSSVNSTSFLLRRDSELIAGSVSLPASDTIGFAAQNEFDLLTVYKPGITTEIADIDGFALASMNAVDWEFTTRDGIWRERQEMTQGAVENPLVIDGGNTLWSFHQRDNLFSGQNDIFARPLQEDGSWGASDLVSNGDQDGNVAGFLNVQRLSNGDLLAVWQELADDGHDEIWYNRYHHTTQSWGSSSRVMLDNYNRLRPVLANNQSDSVFLLFELEDSISMATDLMIIGYSVADDQWQQEQMIANDLDIGSGSGQASIAMDSVGNMMALWFDNNLHCRTRFYNAGTQLWDNVNVFNQTNAGETYLGTQIVVDAQDNFTAAWSQQQTLVGLPFIWTARFTRDLGWQQPQQIIGSTLGYSPILRVNKDDNIMLLWLQEVGSGDDNLLFSGFNVAQNAWTNAELLEDSDQAASQPALVVDRSGNFMAMWNQQRSGSFFDLQGNVALDPASIWVRRFDNSGDGDWLTATTISPIDGAVDKPVMAVNSSGEIMALWMQIIDASTTIQSRYFD